MNTLQATDYMKKLFSDYWEKKLNFPCFYQNIRNFKPKANTPFAKFKVIHTSMKRATLTGHNGKAKYRNVGIIDIEVYVPENTGMDNIITYCENILNIYRKPPFDCLINFEGLGFVEGYEKYSGFCMITVSVHFDYDYIF